MTSRMITCCPACSTLFKVGPDQLRVASGWVRCGQCMAVFDARSRMLPADPYVPADVDWPGDSHDQDSSQQVSASDKEGQLQTTQGSQSNQGISPTPVGLAQPAPAKSKVSSDGSAGLVSSESVPQELSSDAPTRAIAATAQSLSGQPTEKPASDQPAFAPPEFELVSAPAPQEIVPAPMFIGRPPVEKAPAPQVRAATAASLPIPTRDELDRRYARLLETLARLRENSEKGEDESEAANAQPPTSKRQKEGASKSASQAKATTAKSKTPKSPASAAVIEDDPQASKQQGGIVQDGSPEGANKAKPAVKRRSTKAQVPDDNNLLLEIPSTESDPKSTGEPTMESLATAAAQDVKDSEEDLLSRPMIDFVLSEIGGPNIYSAQPSYRDKNIQMRVDPEFETRPNDLMATEPSMPGFVEQAHQRSSWSFSPLRKILMGISALLLVALMGQIMVGQRDRVAASFPVLTPLLELMCKPINCKISPWRHLSAVSIDSSAFVFAGPNSFNFSVTLRNNGTVPLATPALELTLIDAQDQPLVRRVLYPADWGAPTQLDGFGEFNGVALLTMQESANPQAVSNYRLTAFYP